MPNITLLVSPSCGACPSAKSLWKQLRVKYSFSYREVVFHAELLPKALGRRTGAATGRNKQGDVRHRISDEAGMRPGTSKDEWILHRRKTRRKKPTGFSRRLGAGCGAGARGAVHGITCEGTVTVRLILPAVAGWQLAAPVYSSRCCCLRPKGSTAPCSSSMDTLEQCCGLAAAVRREWSCPDPGCRRPVHRTEAGYTMPWVWCEAT